MTSGTWGYSVYCGGGGIGKKEESSGGVFGRSDLRVRTVLQTSMDFGNAETPTTPFLPCSLRCASSFADRHGRVRRFLNNLPRACVQRRTLQLPVATRCVQPLISRSPAAAAGCTLFLAFFFLCSFLLRGLLWGRTDGLATGNKPRRYCHVHRS